MTDLWNQIKNQDYLPKIGKEVGTLLVPPLILGDAAFPLQPWLMKPCTNANTTTKILQQPVEHNVSLEKGDTITWEMDLAIDPKTGNRRDRATYGKRTSSNETRYLIRILGPAS